MLLYTNQSLVLVLLDAFQTRTYSFVGCNVCVCVRACLNERIVEKNNRLIITVSDVDLGHLLTLQGKVAIFKSFISSNVNYSLRNDKSAVIPRANTTKYGLNSFAHEGARIWNSLPNVFRVNEHYRQFRRLIQNWSGPMCKCIICRQ